MKKQRKAPAGTITGHTLKVSWQTPPRLVALVSEYFGGFIPFDAATTDHNPCGAIDFCTEKDSGLDREWPRSVWCNPPYGKALRLWLSKMENEAIDGKEIVALLPSARWETKYFQSTLMRANAICFIRKRVKFINPETGDQVSGNPYANMFVGFNTDRMRFRNAFGKAGICLSVRPLCGPLPE